MSIHILKLDDVFVFQEKKQFKTNGITVCICCIPGCKMPFFCRFRWYFKTLYRQNICKSICAFGEIMSLEIIVPFGVFRTDIPDCTL